MGESDQARLIAERVARRISGGSFPGSDPGRQTSKTTAEIAAVRANISELQQRLAQLETSVREEESASLAPNSYQPSERPFVPLTRSPWLTGVNASLTHPTEERFGVEEATINELVDFFQSEKRCSIDPSGKPCDHCAMCSSRGF